MQLVRFSPKVVEFEICLSAPGASLSWQGCFERTDDLSSITHFLVGGMHPLAPNVALGPGTCRNFRLGGAGAGHPAASPSLAPRPVLRKSANGANTFSLTSLAFS